MYCLVTEVHGCEQLAQSCYLIANWPGVEPVTFQSRIQVQRPNLLIEPPSHPWAQIDPFITTMSMPMMMTMTDEMIQ